MGGGGGGEGGLPCKSDRVDGGTFLKKLLKGTTKFQWYLLMFGFKHPEWYQTTNFNPSRSQVPATSPGEWGGDSINYWVGMCRWESETLSLY